MKLCVGDTCQAMAKFPCKKFLLQKTYHHPDRCNILAAMSCISLASSHRPINNSVQAAANSCCYSVLLAVVRIIFKKPQKSKSDYQTKVISHELRPFCTMCESFNSIVLVSRDEE